MCYKKKKREKKKDKINKLKKFYNMTWNCHLALKKSCQSVSWSKKYHIINLIRVLTELERNTEI